MKPILIEFSGLKSYVEKVSIDFEKLSANGLFGIFGSTGSGKSTILDAIFLALYGRLPKTLSSEDYINSEAGACKVSFVFALKEKTYKKYLIEREYKLAGGRKTTPQPKAALYLVDGEIKTPIAENTEAVNKKIEEIIGLKMNDFSKCIVLPQGQFASFVAMSRGDRINMIGGLFNLEKYGLRLQKSVKTECDCLRQQLDICTAKIQEYSDCTLEVLKEKFDELELKKSLYEKQVVKTDKIKGEYDDFKCFYDRHNELLSKKKSLSELVGKSDWIDKKRRALEKTDKAILIKKTAEKKVKLEKTLAEFLLEKSRLNFSLKSAESNFEKADRDYQKLDELSKKILELRELRDKLNVVSSDANKLKESERKIKESRAKYQKIDSEFESAKTKVKDSFAALGNVNQMIDDEKIDGQLDAILEKIKYSSKAECFRDEIEFLTNLMPSLINSGAKDLVATRIDELKNKCELFSDGVGDDDFGTLKTILERKDELNATLSAAEKKFEVAKTDLEGKNLLRERAISDGVELKEKIDAMKKTVEEVTGGKPFDEFYSEIDSSLKNKEKETDNIKNKYTEAKSLLDKIRTDIRLNEEKTKSVEKDISSLAEEIADMLKDFSSLDDALEIANSPLTDEVRKQIENYDSQKAFLEERIKELYSPIFGKEDFSDDKMQELTKILETEQKNLSTLDKEIDFLQKTYENLSQKSQKRCIIEEKLKEVKKDLNVAECLYDCVKNRRLAEFVSEEYLSSIALDAKETLSVLTGGTYSLVYDKDFLVVDYLRGGIKRRVDTVSGGELFLVSLSLALALSKSIYAKSMRPIEFFFLDEGFGSLDSTLIDVVVDSLEKLRNSHLSIGLISHVEALKERITSKITVHAATSERGSTLSVEG